MKSIRVEIRRVNSTVEPFGNPNSGMAMTLRYKWPWYLVLLFMVMLYLSPVYSAPRELRFALAIAQGVKSFAEPGKYDAARSFEVPILTPLRIVEERKANGAIWYRVERPRATTTGWVDARAVEIWNSRHALKPRGTDDSVIPGYCSVEDVKAAVAGNSRPCMRFDSQLLKRQGDRAPFPVVGVTQQQTEFGSPLTYLEVLAPTLYSNIAPMKGAGKTVALARTLEVLILIDATASMDDDIRRATKAMNELVKRATESSVEARFLVIAYRDTMDSSPDCPSMETSGGDRLEFGDTKTAGAFLKRLKACEGGDEPEALWDALYLLKSVKVTPGASRLLFVLGDAPATTATRGGSWFGVTVPKGLSRGQVFQEIEHTIGHTTAFFGFVVKEGGGLKRTAEEMVQGLQFARQQVRLVGKNIPTEEIFQQLTDVKSGLEEGVSSAIDSAGKVVTSLDRCRKSLATSEQGAQVELFCGDVSLSAERDLASRVRDIVTNPAMDTIVVRRLWVPVRQELDNVALISKSEAIDVMTVFKQLSVKTENGTGCRKLGKNIWYEVMGRVLPYEKRTTAQGSVLNQPEVSRALHDYWRLHSGLGRSILSLSPVQISQLDRANCQELSKRLRGAVNGLVAEQLKHPDSAYLWIPFSELP